MLIFISQADKEGEHGTIHTRTIERPACGAWADAGTACGADPSLQVCAGGYEAEDNPLKGLSQTFDETVSEDSDPEQVSLAFICKRLKLNLKKLSEEEKKWLKRISEKSNLLKNPNPQRGRK